VRFTQPIHHQQKWRVIATSSAQKETGERNPLRYLPRASRATADSARVRSGVLDSRARHRGGGGAIAHDLAERIGERGARLGEPLRRGRTTAEAAYAGRPARMASRASGSPCLIQCRALRTCHPPFEGRRGCRLGMLGLEEARKLAGLIWPAASAARRPAKAG
jgi:hypothetical protein